MSSEIILLWWWEPTDELKEKSRKTRMTITQKIPPKPLPKPIHLITATFVTTKPIITFGTSTAHSFSSTPHQVASSVELPSGQILFGPMTSVSLDGDGLLMAVDEGSAEPVSVTSNKGSVTTLRTTMDWDAQSAELTEDSDTIDESTEASDVDGKFKNPLPPFDVVSWYGNVVDRAPEPLLSLTPTPFERGKFGGQSVNDVLMIRGLIHPPVYLQFFDLSLFTLL